MQQWEQYTENKKGSAIGVNTAIDMGRKTLEDH